MIYVDYFMLGQTTPAANVPTDISNDGFGQTSLRLLFFVTMVKQGLERKVERDCRFHQHQR